MQLVYQYHFQNQQRNWYQCCLKHKIGKVSEIQENPYEMTLLEELISVCEKRSYKLLQWDNYGYDIKVELLEHRITCSIEWEIFAGAKFADRIARQLKVFTLMILIFASSQCGDHTHI